MHMMLLKNIIFYSYMKPASRDKNIKRLQGGLDVYNITQYIINIKQ